MSGVKSKDFHGRCHVSGVAAGTGREPATAGLSDRSAGQTQKIVAGLFAWLVDVGYLAASPASGLPTVGCIEPERQPRFLTTDDTALIREAIAARADAVPSARLARARDLFVVDLFEHTGLHG